MQQIFKGTDTDYFNAVTGHQDLLRSCALQGAVSPGQQQESAEQRQEGKHLLCSAPETSGGPCPVTYSRLPSGHGACALCLSHTSSGGQQLKGNTVWNQRVLSSVSLVKKKKIQMKK